ncbi:MAG TPA: hypothetical protein VIV11_36780 [Kofleriaceae bacterium]
MNARTLLTVPLLIVACGKDAAKDPPPVKIDVAAVNALVPADLQAKIVFEEKSVEEERGRRSKLVYTLAAPKTWTADNEMKMFAKLRPPTDEGYGNFTEVSVGNNCDGRCEAKDWAKVSEKVNFAQFRDKKILKDELSKTSHLMIAEIEDTTYVTYAWWVDGGDHYNTCSAALQKGFGEGPDPRTAAPAFAKACEAVNIKKTSRD